MKPPLPGGRAWKVFRVSLAGVAAVVLVTGVGVMHFGARPYPEASDTAIPLRRGLDPRERLTAHVGTGDLPKTLRMYAELTGREFIPSNRTLSQRLDRSVGGLFSRWKWVKPAVPQDSGICYHRDGLWSAAEVKETLEECLRTMGLKAVPVGRRHFRVVEADSRFAGQFSPRLQP